MSQLLAWSFLFTIPGLLLGSTGLVRKPGIASLPGPVALLTAAVAWLIGAGSHPANSTMAAVFARWPLSPASRRPQRLHDCRPRPNLRLRVLLLPRLPR